MKRFLILFFLFISLSYLAQSPSELAAWRNTPAEDSLIIYSYKENKDNYAVLKMHKNGTYVLHKCEHIYGKVRLGSRDWVMDDKGSWILSGDTVLIRSSPGGHTEKLVAYRKKLRNLSDKNTYKARRRAPKY